MTVSVTEQKTCTKKSAPKTEPSASRTGAIIDVTLDKKALEDALLHVTGLVEQKNTIPILSFVKITIAEKSIRIDATDLDIHAAETVPAMPLIGEGQSFTVHAHTLRDIVKRLKAGAQVSLLLNRKSAILKIASGRAAFELPTLPADDFPDVLGDRDVDQSFEMPAQDFHRILSKTAIAISTEETRYYLCGIYFHPFQTEDGKRLRGVSTDGHRLARCDVDWPKGAPDFPGIIIGRKMVNECLKLFSKKDEMITLSVSNALIRIVSGNLTITSKLIDGSFPDYMRVIPTGNKKVAKVDTSDFVDAVGQVTPVASEKGKAVKLSFLSNGTLIVSCHDSEKGNGRTEIDAEYSAGPLEIGFNSKYALATLSMLTPGGESEIHLSDGSSPSLFLDLEEDGQGLLYVIMPMRV